MDEIFWGGTPQIVFFLRGHQWSFSDFPRVTLQQVPLRLAVLNFAIEWTERDYIDSIQENACWKTEKCTEDRENLMASLIEILTDLCEAIFYRGACLGSILLCLRSLLFARRRLTQAGITASDWLWAPPICYALRSLRSIKTDFSSIFDHRLFTITSPYCLIFTVYYPFCFFFSFGTLRLVSSAAVFWDVTQCFPPPHPHKKKETGTAAHIRTTFLSWSQLPFHFVPNSPFEQPCPARECFFSFVSRHHRRRHKWTCGFPSFVVISYVIVIYGSN